jgi:hypothetical protein
MCVRLTEGLSSCPKRWPDHPGKWCLACQFDHQDFIELFNWASAFPGIPAPAEEVRPCPLEAWQVEAYQSWLELSPDRPVYTLGQLRPSAN